MSSEHTHFADDETLHYIGDLDQEVARLRQSNCDGEARMNNLRVENKRLRVESGEWKQRAEAAEAKLSNWTLRSESCESKLGQLEANEQVMILKSKLMALEEQEPFAYVNKFLSHFVPEDFPERVPLYAKPVPPVDVHWLRIEFEEGYPEDVAFGDERQMSRLKKWLDKFYSQNATIAELERKLAEQRSLVINLPKKMADDIFPQETTAHLMVMRYWKDCADEDKWYPDAAATAELNTLLSQAREEGRKEAVPEGWQVVPKEPTTAMQKAADWHSLAIGYYTAMLEVAPKPEVRP